ncbi:hypothetical protein Leryth_011426 [Lithospermum erythrorhizon]|nr:hypothetical protein Leryth_011426 [Lithospermum erythrorhizon]
MSRALSSSSCYVISLSVSILLNIFFLVFHLHDDIGSGTWKLQKQELLTWSQIAAAEAETVASISCSGHGRAYLDGEQIDGNHVCECHRCYQGPDCSKFLYDCVADADSGDPLVFEPFWMQNAASSALLVAGWHRMSYTYYDHTFISKELEEHLRKVHEIGGNAKADGKFILFGAGSTQLLNAAVFALSIRNTSSPAKVVASTPYYPLYKQQTEFFKNGNYEFAGDAQLFKNNSDITSNVIEFVTRPNNPDGQLNKAILHGPFVHTIHDHAYYWPHFTAIPAPSDEDIMIFTLSKLTGHAGSRFGWALVRDENVYSQMNMYLSMSEMGISRDTQLRAFQLLKTVVEGDGKDIFRFAYSNMKKRWENLTKIISLSKRFSLQEISPQYCTFFQKVRGPSPAYAWLKCEREEDTDCYAVLEEANIIGRHGNLFNADSRYVRLSLLKSRDEFDLLLYRLHELVSMEDSMKMVQQL